MELFNFLIFSSFPIDRFKTISPLEFIFVRLWLHMWSVCYYFLFVISASFWCLGKVVFCDLHYENTPI